MAATPLFAVLFMGLVALLASIGMFVDFGDDATRVIVSFLASVVWGLFGMSSFDVYVDDAATVSEPIYALAYLGLGLAAVTALFAVLLLFQAIRSEAEQTDPEGFLS